MVSKHALIIASGAADEPREELDGRTPLEAARTPALDEIALAGRQGTVATIPPGFAPARDVATLTLLGYDIRDKYTGYAGIEALGRRIFLKPAEMAFRCNLVTVADGRLEDPTAGGVDTASAARMMEALNASLGRAGLRFCPGLSYRHLLVTTDAWEKARCTPPHDMIGERLDRHWPGGRGGRELRELMQAASDLLMRHDLNAARVEAGLRPANGIWLWGQGVLPRLPRFRERFNRRGVGVGAVDLFRGVAMLVGWSFVDVPDPSGGPDIDYAALGAAATAALDEYDLVCVHVESPDEASHAGNLAAKLTAIEQIDRHVVAPLLAKLNRLPCWSILAAPDLAVHLSSRAHAAEPVPFCVAGSGHPRAAGAQRFGESAANASDLHVEAGWDLMEFFLRS